MNVLDIVLIAPVCLGLVFGLFKGLIKELMSLAAIVLGIVGARWFEPQVSTQTFGRVQQSWRRSPMQVHPKWGTMKLTFGNFLVTCAMLIGLMLTPSGFPPAAPRRPKWIRTGTSYAWQTSHSG